MQFIDLQKMGSSLVKQTRQMLQSQQYEWQLKSTSAFSSTVIDRRSGLQAERLVVDYAILERECMLYVLRRSQQRHLVTVLDVIGQRQEEGICNSSREVAIIIEPVPYRLSDLGSLSFAEGMYVLNCVLEGYRVLLTQGVGFYLLDEAAICFTRSGVCKFWINQNLQMPRPNSNRLLSESAFLAALLQTVELRVSSLPQEYIKARKKAYPLNCSTLLSVVQRFRDPQVKAMPSLSSVQMYSPHSTKYESSGKSMRGGGKLSVSKFRKGQQRRQSKRESPYRQEQHAKMSLSFIKNQAEKHKTQHLFVSPSKQVKSVIDPSPMNSCFSSRQPSKLRSPTCTPDSLFQ